jgi:hypothetical protein
MSKEMFNDTLDLSMDGGALFREEAYTDLKAGTVRRLVPVNADGSEDRSRTPIFVGNTQILTEHGPLPVQAALAANNLKEAIAAFPATMQRAVEDLVKELEQMQEEAGREDDSRIIVPR